jgi:hypothetical protein
MARYGDNFYFTCPYLQMDGKPKVALGFGFQSGPWYRVFCVLSCGDKKLHNDLILHQHCSATCLGKNLNASEIEANSWTCL